MFRVLTKVSPSTAKLSHSSAGEANNKLLLTVEKRVVITEKIKSEIPNKVEEGPPCNNFRYAPYRASGKYS